MNIDNAEGGLKENLRHQPGWGGGFWCNKIKLHVIKIGGVILKNVIKLTGM